MKQRLAVPPPNYLPSSQWKNVHPNVLVLHLHAMVYLWNGVMSASMYKHIGGDVNKTTASSLLDVLEWVDEGWPSDGYGGDATESISLFDHPKHATAMFTTDGRRLEDNDAFQKAVKAATDTVGVAVFAYQNGQWIWPGVRIGYEREVVASDGISFTMQTLSLRPTVVSLGQFLSPAESAHIHDLVRDLCPTQPPCSQRTPVRICSVRAIVIGMCARACMRVRACVRACACVCVAIIAVCDALCACARTCVCAPWNQSRCSFFLPVV